MRMQINTMGMCKWDNMSHTRPFGTAFYIILFLEYSTKIRLKKKHDNLIYSTLIRLAINVFKKKCHLEKIQVIKHVLLLLKNIGYNVLLMFFSYFLFI
jgi:hypothetical protein